MSSWLRTASRAAAGAPPAPAPRCRWAAIRSVSGQIRTPARTSAATTPSPVMAAVRRLPPTRPGDDITARLYACPARSRPVPVNRDKNGRGDYARHYPGALVQAGHQVRRGTVRCPCAAHGLAVHGDHSPARRPRSPAAPACSTCLAAVEDAVSMSLDSLSPHEAADLLARLVGRLARRGHAGITNGVLCGAHARVGQ